MRLSEFEVLQLAATLTAPRFDTFADSASYVDYMFRIAETIKEKLEAQQPKGKVEVSSD